jgi:hypothetical protein
VIRIGLEKKIRKIILEYNIRKKRKTERDKEKIKRRYNVKKEERYRRSN